MSFSASITELVASSQAPLIACAPSWARVPLSEVAKVLNGFPWRSELFSQTYGVPLIRIRDVSSGETATFYRGPIPEGYWVENGDLVVGMDGDFNARIWSGGRALLNQRVCKISTDSDFYLSLFLVKVLPGYLDLINSETHSVTVKHLSSRTLQELPLPLPPIEEQRRIVAKIDSLSTRSMRARDELARVRLLIDKFKGSVLRQAFGGRLTSIWREQATGAPTASSEELDKDRRIAVSQWNNRRSRSTRYQSGREPTWQPAIDLPASWRWASVDDISCAIQYGSSAKTNSDPAGVAVLRMGNIQNGRIAPSDLRFLPQQHPEFPDLLLSRGDLLFNRTNSFELVGKTAVFEGGEPTSFASYLIRLRLVGYDPHLLAHYINSSFGRQWIAAVAAQQVGQANVNGTKLSELAVPLMSEEEQREIVRRIEHAFAAIDRLAAEAQSGCALLDKLDQAILAKAFRGELVPQDPNDEPASVLLDRIRAERAGATAPRRRASGDMTIVPPEAARDIVYGLTNTTMPGLVKIGWTSRALHARVAELHTTGVPRPFDVAVAYRVDDGLAIEQALHRAFRPYREFERREFFRVEAYQVEAILALLGTDARAQDVTTLVSRTPELIPNEHIRPAPPRPAADFLHMGLRIGDAISFRRSDATAAIAGRRVIEFEGEVTSLTAATRQLLPDVKFGNAYELWCHQGEVLMTIYDRAYPRRQLQAAASDD